MCLQTKKTRKEKKKEKKKYFIFSHLPGEKSTLTNVARVQPTVVATAKAPIIMSTRTMYLCKEQNKEMQQVKKRVLLPALE